MNIGLDMPVARRPLSGIGAYTAGLAAALAAEVKSAGGAAPAHTVVPLQPLASRHWPAAAALIHTQLGLPAHAWRDRLDVIHAVGSAAPLWGRAPRVMSLHNPAGLEQPDLLPAGGADWYWSRFLPFAARHATCLVTPSHYTAAVAARRLAAPPERIRCVPYPPRAQFAPAPPAREWAVRRRFRLHRPFVLGLGAMDLRKDWGAVVRALALMRRSCPHQLVLAGGVNTGARAEALTGEIRRWGLERRVRRLGWVSSRWLAPLYSAAEAFVYPATYSGYGLPVLEAMACGTPVVTFANTALPETAGGAAVLIPPPYRAGEVARALLDILRQPAHRDDMRQRGLARARQLSWAQTARAMLAIYQEFGRC